MEVSDLLHCEEQKKSQLFLVFKNVTDGFFIESGSVDGEFMSIRDKKIYIFLAPNEMEAFASTLGLFTH